LRNAPFARLACAAALLLAPAAARATEPYVPPDTPVAVTLPPLAWMVERLLGDPKRVVTLLPAGANPHSFEPGLAEVRAAATLPIVVSVGHPGLSFERAVVSSLGAERGHSFFENRAAPPDVAALPDPHVWLSPPIARRMVAQLADELVWIDPPKTAALRERQAALDAELAAIDAEIRRRLTPFRGRSFLSYHPDWTAFAGEYGLNQIVIERGHREPDAAALVARIGEARRADVRLVVVSPQYSRESAEVVAQEIGARVESIDPLARDLPRTLHAMTNALVETFSR
jgi:zinc transport system substrate-binding protein